MIDEPKVEAIQDTNEKDQWGRRFFFFKEGRKFRLDNKTALGVFGGIFGLFATIQLLDPKSTSLEKSGSGIASPPLISMTEVNAVDSKRSTPAHPTQKNRHKRTLAVVKYSGPKLFERPRELGKIPPGTMVSATLVSGASNGPVRAELSEPLTVGGATVIEAGSFLVGEGSSGDDRLIVQFKQVVFKDGSFGGVNAQACDSSDSIAGLRGSKIGNKTLNIVGGIELGFVSGMSQGLQETRGEGGATIRAPSLKNALLDGTTTTATETSRELMSDLKDRKPIIEVPAGTAIKIIFGTER